MEGGREGGREGKREGEREGWREGWREGGREKGRVRGREGGISLLPFHSKILHFSILIFHQLEHPLNHFALAVII